MAADDGKNHNIILRPHCLMDGGGISKLNVRHILQAVFHNAVFGKFYRDLHLIFVIRRDFTDKSNIAIGRLPIIFRLHHLVILMEITAPDFQIRNVLVRRIYQFTDYSV